MLVLPYNEYKKVGTINHTYGETCRLRPGRIVFKDIFKTD